MRIIQLEAFVQETGNEVPPSQFNDDYPGQVRMVNQDRKYP